MRGEAAIGEGNLGGGGCGQGGGDAGDDFEINGGFAEGAHFFGGAAEDQGVAAF